MRQGVVSKQGKCIFATARPGGGAPGSGDMPSPLPLTIAEVKIRRCAASTQILYLEGREGEGIVLGRFLDSVPGYAWLVHMT
jgi:hypothetical protein